MFNRQQGPVTVPSGQRAGDREKGPPMTISHAVVGEMVALQWFDEHGKAHPDVWFKIGNKYYKPPNSEEWADGLNEVKPVFIQKLNSMLSIKASDAPVKDTVDVVAMNVAAEAGKGA